MARVVSGRRLQVEIMKHRFSTLEGDLAAQTARKVCYVCHPPSRPTSELQDTFNDLARKLLHVDHPNADEILQRQNALNARWSQLEDMIAQVGALRLDARHSHLATLAETR